jgi:hypothetical protein
MVGGGNKSYNSMVDGDDTLSATSYDNNMVGGNNTFSATTSEDDNKEDAIKYLLSTTSEQPPSIVGGSILSNTSDMSILQDGGKGSNPGFLAFLKLKKHVATKLDIKNGPDAGKVAGAVQRDIKEQYPLLESIKVSEKAMAHFDKNMEHYKKLLKSKK